MRRLTQALLALVGVIIGTGVASAAPVLHLSGWKASAGKPETFTITRVGGNGPATVTFRTTDGTAAAPIDYTAVAQTITWRNGQSTTTVTIPTFVNLAKAGQNVAFTATITGYGGTSSATGLIVEPATPVPPPPPPTQTCSDGSVILATATCPTPAPVPVAQWVTAPLQDGSFARVKANDSLWDMTGPGAGRPLVPGEIVAVYFNGWGNDADGTTSFAIYALSDGSSGRAKAADLAGVAPVGAPPGLPASWWVPELVTANKTCTDPRAGHESQPGVTQGGVYRAAMLAGSHTKLASGATGYAGTMWQVFASGDLNSPASAAFTVVTGDCLTGQ